MKPLPKRLLLTRAPYYSEWDFVSYVFMLDWPSYSMVGLDLENNNYD